MNRFLLLVIAIAIAILPFKSLAIYEPEYVVLEEAEGFEVREYREMIVARTRVEANFDQAGNVAFRRLAGYIFGDNNENQKISMTAPVFMEPETDKKDVYWISFVMPDDYQLADLPAPDSGLVELIRVPATRLAVVTYRGGWSKKKYDHHRERLRSLLMNSTWEIAGEPVWARYNSPLRPAFLRSNEIMLPVEQQDKDSRQAATSQCCLAPL